MRLFALFIESFRVASQLGNARGAADIDLARNKINACCDKTPARRGMVAASSTTIFDGPFAKQA